MTHVSDAMGFVNAHKGAVAMTSGVLASTGAFLWWLATGGAVAFTTSLAALNDPDVAQTLQDLPAYHARVEETLLSISRSQEQIADALDSLQAESKKLVEWAPAHSQALTEEVGGCVAGDPCQVFFRGKLTQAGAQCDLTISKPRLLNERGDEFPITFTEGFTWPELTLDFDTYPVWIDIPPFIQEGRVGILVLQVFSNCPFTGPAVEIERSTFRLLVEITD